VEQQRPIIASLDFIHKMSVQTVPIETQLEQSEEMEGRRDYVVRVASPTIGCLREPIAGDHEANAQCSRCNVEK